MKFGIVLLLILGFQNVYAQDNIQHTINESWKFIKSDEIVDVKDFYSKLGIAKSVDLPHTWNDKDVVDETKGYYRGTGWYAKEVRIPTSYKNKEVFLFFEGVNTVAEVYINSKLAGQHIGGYTRFVIPISDLIQFDEEKKLTTFKVTVKADNRFDENVPTLAADFTFFGGIYRDVNLVVKDKVHFNFEEDASNGCFITTPKVTADQGEVHLKAHIKNSDLSKKKIKLINKIYSPTHQLIQEKVSKLTLQPNKTTNYEFDFDAVTTPLLWSPNTPHLYSIVSEIWDVKTNTKLDEVINPLGFRWFKFDTEKGFFLNGEPLKLIGTNRHQDYKNIGNALPDYLHTEDVRMMKEMGSNFLRISHYPQDPAILEACDRLGILTTVETPVVNTITENETFDKNCLSAQLEMIRQNYNHPSLIIWAYMNEILLKPKYKNDPQRYKKYTDYVLQLAQKLETLTRREDPYRYTMIPNHSGLERYKEAGLTDVPMIVGWNIYDGWYGREFDALEAKLTKYHEGVDKPLIITEYGAGADPRLHSLNPTRFDFTQEYATAYHQHYMKVIKKLPFVAGANVWNYADFSSEQRVDAVQSINNKGLVGIDRKPKDVFYFYQASLLKTPFIGISTKSWKRRSCIEDLENKGFATMPVQVFSNQSEVELFINGKSIGSQKVQDAIATFEVPFTNGINRLKAVAGKVEDYSEVRIDLLPQSFETFPINGLSINLGDERFFYDDQIDQAWGLNQNYTKGSWGSIGGKPFIKTKKRKQHPYGTNQPVAGTFNDPIYQTQLVGIEEFRLDVPPGLYEVRLHFAELEGTDANHLPYDLTDTEAVKTGKVSRTFSVKINNQMVINKLDLLNQYGEYKKVKIKSQTRVGKDEPLIIQFDKVIGEPVLNAIEIYKKL
ncbi:glycoside hydrolase family 2 TIM barrel-domain containing protein [Flammeovirga sp. OC4]|uniref:glycoside hydrolase family 2 TIM barrel-domain containing protein n=1 Tax=Flammeovirga sp. OC4 TaxID=1382345 RepID=UPI0006938630|nr:glycoside hydrolase family 2 TIM barrel-domain containing protein [Flammeovirga sp. OC4]